MIESSAAQTTIIVLDCCYSGAFKGANLPESLKGNGRFLLTSCRSGQLANDATRRNGTSLFTQHLVDGLVNAVPDGNGDGYVDLGEIYDYVHARLRREGRQIPQRSFAGDGSVAVARRPQKLPVSDGAAPSGFELSQTTLELDDVEPDEVLPPEQVYVLTEAGRTVYFSVHSDADWLEVEAHEGYFSVVLHPRPGANRANVLVRDHASGSVRTLRVKVRVREPEGRPAPPTDRPRPWHGRLHLRGRGPIPAVVGLGLALTALLAVLVIGRGGSSTSSTPVSGPGPATLYEPADVVVDAMGAVYVADARHDRVRRIDPDGRVTTVVGHGGDDPAPDGDRDPARSTSIGSVTALALDPSGNLYLAKTGSEGGVLKVTTEGVISSVPIHIPGSSGEPAVSALTVAPDGGLLLAAGHEVLKVDQNGAVRSVAGTGVEGYTGDGGPATAARLNNPNGLAVRGDAIYIADTDNNRVRMVRPDGTIVTVAGTGTDGSSPGGGPAVAADVARPYDVVVDDAGNLYITTSNQVRRVTPEGVIGLVAGHPDDESGFSGDGGLATAAILDGPVGVARDSAGNLYVSDYGNHRVRKISADGRIATIG